ncbi:MAG: glycosyltransferase [Proteobacteria bacterium]|nr:glycosyltransferase [Pseudomonadota bacterium]
MKQTAIIIPCYNEAERLDQSKIMTYLKNTPDVSFVFVNDGSTDGTSQVIDRLKKEHPLQIHALDLCHNSGKAEAVRQGILKAIPMSFSYIGYWDADLSTPLDTINDFCELLDQNQAHTVIGSRVKLLGRNIEREKTRHYLGRIFATFASMILKLPIYDTQCGAKLFKNSTDLKQVFSSPFKVNWAFDIEMIARYKLITELRNGPEMRTAIIEHPLDEWVHKQGSKVKGFDFIKAPMELIKLFVILYVPHVSAIYRKTVLKGVSNNTILKK